MKSCYRIIAILILVNTVRADTTEEIAKILEPIRKENGMPALAAGVFNEDGLIAQGAVGVRKAGDDIKVTTGDLWHLGSDTKAMTATLAGSFVAEGKLGWDDTMEKCFPEFADEMNPILRKVTVSQLLSHRGGLSPNLRWTKFLGMNLMKARAQAARDLLITQRTPKVGVYAYSNAGYVLVGAILEKISGQSWEDLIKLRLFDPLKMKTAGFGGTGTVGKIDQPWGHFKLSVPVPSNGSQMDNPEVMGPAGTVHMSIEDWSKFLADQIRGGAGGEALLPPEIYARIQSPYAADGDYGFGWGIAERRWAGGKTLTHKGSNLMNLAVCSVAIPRRFGIVVCMNQAGDEADQAANQAMSALIEWYQKRQP